MHGAKPRSERTDATLADVRAENITPEPGKLEQALSEALRDTERFAVIIVDLDTGKSHTAFIM